MSEAPAGGFGAFRRLGRGVGLGAPRPAGWRALAEGDLVVLVGLTGVGKTSTLALVLERLGRGGLLPDRRELTDKVIIGTGAPASDRLERFARTRRFRDEHPGGMAAILAAIAIDPAELREPLFFDGLRGPEEVAHAAAALPRARFVALSAGNAVRLARLLGRADPFDRLGPTARLTEAGRDGDAAALAAAEGLLAPAEIEALRRAISAGRLLPAEVEAKLAIIREEQLSYDPELTFAALRAAAGGRCLVLETDAEDVESVAGRALRFLLQPGISR